MAIALIALRCGCMAFEDWTMAYKIISRFRMRIKMLLWTRKKIPRSVPFFHDASVYLTSFVSLIILPRLKLKSWLWEFLPPILSETWEVLFTVACMNATSALWCRWCHPSPLKLLHEPISTLRRLKRKVMPMQLPSTREDLCWPLRWWRTTGATNLHIWSVPFLLMHKNLKPMIRWLAFWRTRTMRQFTRCWNDIVSWMSLTGYVHSQWTSMLVSVLEHLTMTRVAVKFKPVAVAQRSISKVIWVMLGWSKRGDKMDTISTLSSSGWWSSSFPK